MPLTGTASAMANQIVTQIKATANPPLTPAQESKMITDWTAICTGMITHITTNAVVNTTVTGATSAGTPGGPLPITAQPGVGVIT